MKAQRNNKPQIAAIAIRRVIPASVIRRFHSDIARQTKSKKVIRRMRKERNDG